MLRKTARPVGANMHWSQATRARMVPLALGSLTRVCKNLNQDVAAGPKMAGKALVEHLTR